MIDLIKEKNLDERYLRMATIWAENSHAIRRKVGCLIVKNKRIISDGYNGTPSGFDNVCENIYCKKEKVCKDFNTKKCFSCSECSLVTKSCVLHAEANAISKIAKSSNSSDGATLYVTDEPCLECSKLIIQAGIKRVVYQRDYHSHEGTKLLVEANIIVNQIKKFDLK